MQAHKNQTYTLWLDTPTANLIWCWQQYSVWRPPEILPANTHRMPALAKHYIREREVSILYFGSIDKWMQREKKKTVLMQLGSTVICSTLELTPVLIGPRPIL